MSRFREHRSSTTDATRDAEAASGSAASGSQAYHAHPGAVTRARTARAATGYRAGGARCHSMRSSGTAPWCRTVRRRERHLEQLLALRIGVKERGCERRGVWCVYASTDIGYRHQHATTKSEHSDESVAIVVPRVGLDVGGNVVRVRVGFETSISRHSWQTLGLAGGDAFSWQLVVSSSMRPRQAGRQ